MAALKSDTALSGYRVSWLLFARRRWVEELSGEDERDENERGEDQAAHC